jgi:hypothetical protein
LMHDDFPNPNEHLSRALNEHLSRALNEHLSRTAP